MTTATTPARPRWRLRVVILWSGLASGVDGQLLYWGTSWNWGLSQSGSTMRPGSMRGGQGWRYFGVPGTILNPCWRVLDQRLNLESIVQPASIPECMHIRWTWLSLRRV